MSETGTKDTICSKPSQPTDKLVLVVEDNEKNGRLIMAMLNAAGYQTQWAMDGREGLRLAAELHPALILTDLQMPHLDGLAMTRALKCQAATAAIPIIAITAHAMEEHRLGALAAGCAKFLTKPIRYQALLAEVADAIQCS